MAPTDAVSPTGGAAKAKKESVALTSYIAPIVAFGAHAAWLFNTYTTHFAGAATNPIASGAFELPLATPIIGSAAYVIGCWALKRYMDTRSPVNFKAWLRVYNVYLIALSMAMFVGLTAQLRQVGRVTWHLPLENSAAGSSLAFWLWVNYNSKFLEFFDTLWILLGKKNEQYSFLHWQHHLVMGPVMWLVTQEFPGGTSAFAPAINSAIHTVMYTFYLLSSVGLGKYLPGPVKMSVTLGQITQFFAISFHAWYHMVTAPGKYWTVRLAVVEGVLMVDMIVLFGTFFVKTYCTKKPGKKGADKAE